MKPADRIAYAYVSGSRKVNRNIATPNAVNTMGILRMKLIDTPKAIRGTKSSAFTVLLFTSVYAP